MKNRRYYNSLFWIVTGIWVLLLTLVLIFAINPQTEEKLSSTIPITFRIKNSHYFSEENMHMKEEDNYTNSSFYQEDFNSFINLLETISESDMVKSLSFQLITNVYYHDRYYYFIGISNLSYFDDNGLLLHTDITKLEENEIIVPSILNIQQKDQLTLTFEEDKKINFLVKGDVRPSNNFDIHYKEGNLYLNQNNFYLSKNDFLSLLDKNDSLYPTITIAGIEFRINRHQDIEKFNDFLHYHLRQWQENSHYAKELTSFEIVSPQIESLLYYLHQIKGLYILIFICIIFMLTIVLHNLLNFLLQKKAERYVYLLFIGSKHKRD